MLQFPELCRLCAQKKKNKLDLFERDDDETTALLGKISLYLSVHIAREDLLPKMVCNDCQKVIEQFHTFRIKCQKAEERLNKMLSLNLPNKALITNIKQEYLEPDYHENNQVQFDTPKQYESPSLINLKSLKNVKLEVEESDEENIISSPIEEGSQDLIQIISEEIVNHNSLIDVKQPVIEIISENFIQDYKNRDIIQNVEIPYCDIKVLRSDQLIDDVPVENAYDINADVLDRSVDPAAVIEVKIQEPESEIEHQSPQQDEEIGNEVKLSVNENVKKVRKSKRKDIVESDVEIDKKYLHLAENEECNVDLEEWEVLIKKNNDPNMRFNCRKCKKSFKFFKCWKKHKSLHENEPDSFICDTCCNNNAKVFKFSNFKCLKSHIKRKHLQGGVGNFKCHLCQRVLPSQGQLNAHLRKVHDDSGASCQKCGKFFKNKTRLMEHMKVHSEDKPYVCDQCGKSFKWNNGLKVHMQTHNQEKNFLCSECGKKFSAKKNLLEHLNIHTGKRPHVCKYCNATFVQLSAYSKHLYTHNEDLKLHKCDKCDKSFSHDYLLKMHKIQHTGVRPYSCSVCLNSFKSQSDLCTHVKMHQEKQYSCNVCGRKFSRSKTLKDHMVRHTGRKHACPAPGCGKSYTQRFPLTKHFFKNHPSLKIINRSGGRKAHLGDKTIKEQENCQILDYIQYDYKTRDD